MNVQKCLQCDSQFEYFRRIVTQKKKKMRPLATNSDGTQLDAGWGGGGGENGPLLRRDLFLERVRLCRNFGNIKRVG